MKYKLITQNEGKRASSVVPAHTQLRVQKLDAKVLPDETLDFDDDSFLASNSKSKSASPENSLSQPSEEKGNDGTANIVCRQYKADNKATHRIACSLNTTREKQEDCSTIRQEKKRMGRKCPSTETNEKIGEPKQISDFIQYPSQTVTYVPIVYGCPMAAPMPMMGCFPR